MSGDDAPSLAEWLLTQVSDDEAVAQACFDSIGGGRAGEPYDDGSGDRDRDDFPSYPWGSGAAELAFMALAQPARVLAECQMKRDIIAGWAFSDDPRSRVDFWLSQPDAVTPDAVTAEMIRVARLLAAPYSDRPGYRQEWTP